MECPAFLRGLKCAGQRGGGRIHSQGGDLYHMGQFLQGGNFRHFVSYFFKK